MVAARGHDDPDGLLPLALAKVAPVTRLAVTLTVEELRELVREVVREEIVQSERDLGQVASPTEDDLAWARKRLRRMGHGT